jgi:hypothetical protein
MFAIRGRRMLKRRRISESGLASELKRSPSEECTVKGGRSLWIRNSREAFRRADVIVITKSGAARVRGHNIPRPP